jgi:hypothetical protein
MNKSVSEFIFALHLFFSATPIVGRFCIVPNRQKKKKKKKKKFTVERMSGAEGHDTPSKLYSTSSGTGSSIYASSSGTLPVVVPGKEGRFAQAAVRGPNTITVHNTPLFFFFVF